MADFLDEFIHTFIGSTIVTLKVQCKMEAKHTASFIKGEKPQAGSFEIGSLLSIRSHTMKGTLSLCFTKGVYLKILQNLIGETSTEITKDNEDAAAELLNIIFAQAKTALNKHGHAVQKAIPSILRGKTLECRYGKNQKVHVLAFQVEGEEFYIELASDPVEQTERDEAEQHEKVKPAPAQASDKTQFVMQFLQSTVMTFKVQFGLQVKPGKPYEKFPEYHYPFDIAGIIGIISNTFNGSYLLVFKQETFLKLASKAFGEPVTEFQPETADLVAELTNMVLGAAKRILNPLGHGIQMAIPTVVRGSEVQSNLPKSRKVVVIPFESEIGSFHVELDVLS